MGLAARALRVLPPETAHHATIAMLKRAPRWALPSPDADDPALAVDVAGLKLANPVGLAAGFDKGAEVPAAMAQFGFGFVECGTVTPQPQAGNPRPRLFRLPQDAGVINRMGFNSTGLTPFLARMRRLGAASSGGIPIGANLGANKDSADRIADYVSGLMTLWGLAGYFTINISSPNTPGLRGLQDPGALADLLGRLAEARTAFARETPAAPMFLKVAPDLDDGAVEAITTVACGSGAIDGFIVSNTTLDRPDGLRERAAAEEGGLSGRPLFERSTRVLRRFREAAGPDWPLIGVGGVESGRTAYAKIRAGASAVQLYTALALRGPGLVPRIKRKLTRLLKADGYSSVAEAVGADVPL